MPFTPGEVMCDMCGESELDHCRTCDSCDNEPIQECCMQGWSEAAKESERKRRAARAEAGAK